MVSLQMAEATPQKWSVKFDLCQRQCELKGYTQMAKDIHLISLSIQEI